MLPLSLSGASGQETGDPPLCPSYLYNLDNIHTQPPRLILPISCSCFSDKVLPDYIGPFLICMDSEQGSQKPPLFILHPKGGVFFSFSFILEVFCLQRSCKDSTDSSLMCFSPQFLPLLTSNISLVQLVTVNEPVLLR